MSAERVIANLLRIAREDLEGARLLNTRTNRNAIYLCEQAAEKIIRAVLTSEKIHAGIKHQLEEMIDLVPDENPIKNHLSTYATSYRYTTPTGRIPPDPSRDEVETAAKQIEATLTEAARGFGVDLDAVDKPAATSSPIR